MATCVMALSVRISNVNDKVDVNIAMRSDLKGSHSGRGRALVVILYEICETRRRLVSQISYEVTTLDDKILYLYRYK